jgi:anaerobic glycerol-3-phosphate dehydrogenase
VAQAGLELVILLPLPPSVTGMRHHNQLKVKVDVFNYITQEEEAGRSL